MINESPEDLKKIAETWEDSYNGHAVELKKKRLLDLLESPELFAAQKAMKEASDTYSADNEQWWNNLSEEDREKAFYSVCKRIHKADIEKNGSYRYALYQVFGFDMSMYGVGMDCGYMDIHNKIYGGETLDKMANAKTIIIKNKTSTQTIEINDYQKVFLKLKDDDSIIEIEIKELPKTYDNNV
jgi:hypothetical protein